MRSGDPDACDPVCGMTVDPSGPYQRRHGATTYHFCSQRCQSRFREEPERFASESRPREEDLVLGASGGWTCPMHTEIVRDGPGSCPICGMALDPMSPAEEENPELALIVVTDHEDKIQGHPDMNALGTPFSMPVGLRAKPTTALLQPAESLQPVERPGLAARPAPVPEQPPPAPRLNRTRLPT